MIPAGIASSAYVKPKPLDTSIARWGFAEGSGTTSADLSGNNNTLTATGSPWNTTGRTGGGMKPSVSGYFTCSLGTGPLTKWTIMLWYRCDGIPVDQYSQFFFDISDMSGADNNLWTDLNNTLNWGFWAGGAHYSTEPLVVGNWYHLTWSYDGATVTCYQNSVVTSSTAASVSLQKSDTFCLGHGYDGSPNGIIDDVRIFDTPLTVEEITRYANLHVA